MTPRPTRPVAMPLDPDDPALTQEYPPPAFTLSEQTLPESPTGTHPSGEPGPAACAPAGYEIVSELGRGGMGVVYLARSKALDRMCALKVILAGSHAGEGEVGRFRAEARAVARLSHPGIVQVYEVGESEGLPFMALELCRGGSLGELTAKAPMTPRHAAAVVRSVAAAVQAAHDSGVVHRDLKPQNVLLTERGEPKVTDFGLAKKLDEEGATRTGSLLGTPSYMSPEQAEGRKDVGPPADVYALGAILYECLTGRPPFRSALALDTLHQVLNREPVAVRSLNPAAPADLETVAHKCLNKDATRRYASAGEMADDLGRWLAGEPIRARPVGVAERLWKWVRRNRAVSSLAAGTAASLVGGLAASLAFALETARTAERLRVERDRADENARAARTAADDARRAEARADDRADFSRRQSYAGKLALARSAFDAGDGDNALAHLEACRWDLRGWEHGHLLGRFDARQTFVGHDHYVSCVAWSPDGSALLSCDHRGTVMLRDAATGQVSVSLPTHASFANAVAWCPDGTRYASAGNDGTLWVRYVAPGRPPSIFRGAARKLFGLAWTADGTRVVVGGEDSTLTVIDPTTGRAVRTFPAGVKRVNAVAAAPTGTRVVVGGNEGTVSLFDAATGVLVWSATHGDAVLAVAWSPDGTRVVSATTDGRAVVRRADTGGVILTLAGGHAGRVNAVAWSPDGTRVVTAGRDRRAVIWDAADGKVAHVLRGHRHYVFAAAWSPDGRRVATGAGDRTVKVWDAEAGQEVPALCRQGRKVTALAWRPDGSRFATGGSDGTVAVRDAAGKPVARLPSLSSDVVALSYSPDGSRLLAAAGKAACVFDAETGRRLLALPSHLGRIECAAWTPDGRRVLTGGRDRVAVVRDAATGEAVRSIELDEPPGIFTGVFAVAWSPDGRRFLACGHLSAGVYDLDTGKRLFALPTRKYTQTSASWSPDGRRILLAGLKSTAHVHDAEDGAEIFALRGHTSGILSARWSPDGRRVLTSSGDGTLRLWDAATGQEAATLTGSTARVGVAEWSPDGRAVLVAGGDAVRLLGPGRRQSLFRFDAERPVVALGFADGSRLVARDEAGGVAVWDMRSGEPANADGPAGLVPAPGPVKSDDGAAIAEAADSRISVTVPAAKDPAADRWPLPDAAGRAAHHADRADLAAGTHPFAEAFHVGRLLLDRPGDADLEKRRAALARHAAGVATAPAMPRVP